MELEEGQQWDDILTLTLTREQAWMALSSMSIMLHNIRDGMEQAAESANRGDVTAMLVGPHLLQSGKDMQDALRALTQQLLPALWAEVEARDALEAALAGTDAK
jgi:hypothetical protein